MAKSPDGRGYTCKPCSRARSRQWNIEHHERFKENQRAYWDRNNARVNARRRKRREDDPEFREQDKAQKREAYHANRDAELERQHEYRARPEFRSEQAARAAIWREDNRDHLRAYQLKRWYGITQEDYDAMLAAQDGVCAICGGPPRGRGKLNDVFVVDHDHNTGVIRGLLCSPCNTAVGQMDDDPERLRRAAVYLGVDRGEDALRIPADRLAKITWNRPR